MNQNARPSGRLFKAAALVAALTLAGRALGFVRDVVIAHHFGANAQTDAYLVAWTVPETAAPLLLESAVLYALIPVFVRAQASGIAPRLSVSRTLVPIVTALLVLTAVVAISAPAIVSVLAPGLAEEALATRSVRIASLTVLGFGIAGFLVAALRSREIFGVPASVYLAYNAGIIATIVVLEGEHGVFAAALGLSIGSALMVVVQVPTFLRRIGRPAFRAGSFSYTAGALAPFVPIGLFVLLRHSQVYIERFLSSFVEPGAISFLNYAERVTQVPLGFAVAIGVVAFPTMARSAVAHGSSELRASFERTLRLAVLVTVPAAVALTVFAGPLIEVLFERGSFAADETQATAAAMQFYAWGLVAQAVVTVTVLPVYALRQQIRQPIAAAAVGIAATVATAAVAVPLLDLRGVALASAVGVTVMAADLLRRVHSRVLPLEVRALALDLARLAVAAAAALAAALAAKAALPADAWAQAMAGSAIVFAVFTATAAALDVGESRLLLRRGSPGEDRMAGR